jgi:hypothetical protein
MKKHYWRKSLTANAKILAWGTRTSEIQHICTNTHLADRVVGVSEEHPPQVGRVGGQQQQDALLQHQHVPAAALVVALGPHEQWADHLLRACANVVSSDVTGE